MIASKRRKTAPKKAKKRGSIDVTNGFPPMPKIDPRMVLQDCRFVGVEFPQEALSAIETIATALAANAHALRENALALGQMAQTLNSNHVHIDTLVKFEKGASRIAITGGYFRQ